MTRISYGSKIKARARRLLAALLDYANHDIEDSSSLDIDCHWQREDQLVIRTKLKILEQLTAQDSEPGKLSKGQIREAIKRLEDFVGILTDNRTKTKGSEDWHFTLKLQSKNKATNLSYFHREWERGKETAGISSSTPQHSANKGDRNYLRSLPKQNLPRQINEFIGRESELEQLLEYMSLDYRPPYINVDGIGGVGKTALVLEAAYRCWEFRHGVSTVETPLFDAIIFTTAKKNELLPSGVVPVLQRQNTLREIFREIGETLQDPTIIQASPKEQLRRIKHGLEQQKNSPDCR